DDGFDGVFAFGIEFDADVGGEFDQFAIDARADKTFAGQALDDVAKLAFFLAHDGSEDHDARTWRESHDSIDDVGGRLMRDWFASVRGMRLADIGEEETEVIVNLSGGRDDGTRIGAGT